MRARPIVVAAWAAALLAPTAAIGAPTCWNAEGETVRCGTPGAMPVGSTLSPAQRAARAARPSSAPTAALAGVAIVLVGLFGLFAALPDFERFDR
jgi:hypothetical protein